MPEFSDERERVRDAQAKQARPLSGSPTFYALLKEMESIHDRKSQDYASNDKPYGNYYFAGMLSKLFDDPNDSGFIGRLGEKIYRLANLSNNKLTPQNESIEDTERDICVIVALWVASRRDSRRRNTAKDTAPLNPARF